jgi:hypothetical protein
LRGLHFYASTTRPPGFISGHLCQSGSDRRAAARFVRRFSDRYPGRGDPRLIRGISPTFCACRLIATLARRSIGGSGLLIEPVQLPSGTNLAPHYFQSKKSR